MAGVWDFTVDSEIQSELSKKISTASDNFDVKVEQMYTQIGSMSQYWVGEDYDKFQEGTRGYENALKDLSDGMRMYSKHLDKMVIGTDELSTELITIVDNITGTNNAGGTSGATGGTGSTGSGGYIGGSPEAVNGGNSGDDITGTYSEGGTEGSNSSIPDGNTTEGQDVPDGNTTEPSGDTPLKTSNEGTNLGQTQSSSGGSTGESVTYKSGDSVNINGQNYNVYGGITKPNGEIVMMYGDKTGNLYYQSENGALENVTYTYTQYSNGGRQYSTRTENATVNDLGSTYNNGFADMPKVLKVGEEKISSIEQVATSITCPLVASSPVLNGINNGSYVDSQTSIVSDGTLRSSYNGQFDGASVNGSTLVKATSMDDFSTHLKPNEDGVVDVTIQLPQGVSVQWDPSNAWNNGHDFDTSNGPLYLRWDAAAANGVGAYKQVDEYGNYTNDKEYTLDGFNNTYGHWK